MNIDSINLPKARKKRKIQSKQHQKETMPTISRERKKMCIPTKQPKKSLIATGVASVVRPTLRGNAHMHIGLIMLVKRGRAPQQQHYKPYFTKYHPADHLNVQASSFQGKAPNSIWCHDETHKELMTSISAADFNRIAEGYTKVAAAKKHTDAGSLRFCLLASNYYTTQLFYGDQIRVEEFASNHLRY